MEVSTRVRTCHLCGGDLIEELNSEDLVCDTCGLRLDGNGVSDTSECEFGD